ncbi:MAG: hypothetical protein ACR2FJ_00290 [Qipengyuania sp.]
MMALVLIFLAGIINFAANKAVLESRHPILDQLPRVLRAWSGRMPLVAEFIVLLAAMLLVANGYSGFRWGYGAYTVFNLLSAWAILTRRI